jgi:hypothetical protein
VTGSEALVHHYEPSSKYRSMNDEMGDKPTKPPSKNSGWVEKEWVFKEKMNKLPNFESD